MNKRLMTIFAVFLLLFLVGCKREAAPVAGRAFVGGTEGLEIKFLSGLPPDETFDKDSPFQISVSLENKGEFNIESPNDITVAITGINPADFGVSSGQLSFKSPEALSGVSIDGAGNVIKGQSTQVDFPTMQYGRAVSGTVPFTIKADVCYEYGTQAQASLCVREDLRGVTGEQGVCDPNRQAPAETSGAPIQISNIRQNVAGSNKIDFFFTVKKVAGITDSLYKSGSMCDPAIASRDVVFVEVADTGLGPLTCSGLRDGTARSGLVTLVDGQREIRCSQTITNPADFEQVISISLKYAYKEFVEKTLNVRHSS